MSVLFKIEQTIRSLLYKEACVHVDIGKKCT